MCCNEASRWICCCRGSLPGRTDTVPDGEKSDRQTLSQTHHPPPNTPLMKVKRICGSYNQFYTLAASVSHQLFSPVQLFSVQFHTPPTHTLRTYSGLAAHWKTLFLQGHSLTTHCILAEAHVLVDMMSHGTHMGNDLQQCTFHCEEWDLRGRKHVTSQESTKPNIGQIRRTDYHLDNSSHPNSGG